MDNYLLGKMNRIRPSRTLYDNSFRNDNSLKNICQRNTFGTFGQNCDGCDGWQFLWDPILGLNLNADDSSTLDHTSVQKLKKSIKIKYHNRASQKEKNRKKEKKRKERTKKNRNKKRNKKKKQKKKQKKKKEKEKKERKNQWHSPI